MSRKSEMSPWNVGISAQAQLIQMAVCFLATIHRLHRLHRLYRLHRLHQLHRLHPIQCIFDDLCIFRFDFRDTPTIAQRSPSEEKLQSKLHHLTMIWSQSKNKSWCEITWEREFNKPTDATQFPQTLPASQIPASVPAGTAALRPGHRNSLGFLTLASSRISSTSSHCHQMKENELWVLEKKTFHRSIPSHITCLPMTWVGLCLRSSKTSKDNLRQSKRRSQHSLKSPGVAEQHELTMIWDRLGLKI